MQLTINVSMSDLNQEDLKNQVIRELSIQEFDELERYAVANQLQKAIKDAASEFSDDAIHFALNPANNCQPAAGQGIQFNHNGHAYQIQFTNHYNYDQNDENGRQWATCVKEIESLEAKKSALTKKKKGFEAVILADHPRLQPTQTDIVLKYISSKS